MGSRESNKPSVFTWNNDLVRLVSYKAATILGQIVFHMQTIFNNKNPPHLVELIEDPSTLSLELTLCPSERLEQP